MQVIVAKLVVGLFLAAIIFDVYASLSVWYQRFGLLANSNYRLMVNPAYVVNMHFLSLTHLFQPIAKTAKNVC